MSSGWHGVLGLGFLPVLVYLPFHNVVDYQFLLCSLQQSRCKICLLVLDCLPCVGKQIGPLCFGRYCRGRWITLLSCSFYLLISSQSLVNTGFPAFIHVSLKSYSTSKGTQHDIVSISRCLHLEHLLFLFFHLLKSYSFAIHDIKLLFNIWISNGLTGKIPLSP